MSLGTELAVRLDFGFDWRVFCYALTAALLTGLVVGALPALRLSRMNLNELLRQGGRGVVGGKHRVRQALVMAQVAGSLPLLVVAGLFIRSLGAIENMHLGFNPNNVVNFTMDPQELGYNEQRGREFYARLLEQVRRMPGVESASLASNVPMGYYGNIDGLQIDEYVQPADRVTPTAEYDTISPGYFATMQIELSKGRPIQEDDSEKAPLVAVINETMAARFWPHQEAIGREFRLASEPRRSLRVVGIVKDSVYRSIGGPIRPFFYAPLAQHYSTDSLQTLQLRTQRDPRGVIPEVRRLVGRLAPGLPVFEVKTMNDALYTANGFLLYRLGAGLAAAMGLLGLALAVVGVYGVIAYATAQRTHEIGVRMALGARPESILRLILGQGSGIVGAGLVLGLLAAFAAGKAIGTFIRVSPNDPVTYVVVTLLLTIVALAACLIPARRAMRVDPMVALHYE
jgi:putative ABC transport system permease protein